MFRIRVRSDSVRDLGGSAARYRWSTGRTRPTKFSIPTSISFTAWVQGIRTYSPASRCAILNISVSPPPPTVLLLQPRLRTEMSLSSIVKMLYLGFVEYLSRRSLGVLSCLRAAAELGRVSVIIGIFVVLFSTGRVSEQPRLSTVALLASCFRGRYALIDEQRFRHCPSQRSTTIRSRRAKTVDAQSGIRMRRRIKSSSISTRRGVRPLETCKILMRGKERVAGGVGGRWASRVFA